MLFTWDLRVWHRREDVFEEVHSDCFCIFFFFLSLSLPFFTFRHALVWLRRIVFEILFIATKWNVDPPVNDFRLPDDWPLRLFVLLLTCNQTIVYHIAIPSLESLLWWSNLVEMRRFFSSERINKNDNLTDKFNSPRLRITHTFQLRISLVQNI